MECLCNCTGSSICINVLVAHFWREQASIDNGHCAIGLLQQMKIDALVGVEDSRSSDFDTLRLGFRICSCHPGV
jgi:hypothetical protein